jgi:hypothetical protein
MDDATVKAALQAQQRLARILGTSVKKNQAPDSQVEDFQYNTVLEPQQGGN